MLTPEGGFASSLDADSEHEEGKFYVWSEAEIDAVLGERAALFKRFYDVTPEGNWEGKTILNRSSAPERADEETERELAACRALLFQARAQSRAPGLGRQGAGRLERADDRGDGQCRARLRAAGMDRARRAAPSISSAGEMTGADGRLLHSWRAGRARHPASVDDYANLCRAALALHEATGDDDFLDASAQLGRRSSTGIIGTTTAGGYFFAANDTEGLIARAKTAADSAVPAGQRHDGRGA